MAPVSKGAGGALALILAFGAAMLLACAAQWFVPDRTVRPIAERFLCSGAAQVTPASATAQTEVLSRVECVNGATRDNVTTMAFSVLCIPSGLVVAAGLLFTRRVLTPKPKTRIQRARA